MKHSALIIVSLLMVLGACSQRGGDVVDVQDRLRPELAGIGELSGLPAAVPGGRTTTTAAVYLYGSDSYASSIRAIQSGTEMEMTTLDDGLTFAVYEFTGTTADAIASVGYVVCDRASMFTDVILAISNYETGRWEFLEPIAEDSATLLIDGLPGEHTNQAGKTYLAVIAYDQASFTIRSVKMTFSNRDPLPSDWDTKGHDNQRTHHSEQLVVESADLQWKVILPALLDASSPCIGGDGTIYVGSFTDDTAGLLFAISPLGEINWAYEALDNITSSPALSQTGNIFFGDRARHFYSINALGQRAWLDYPDREFWCSPVIDESRSCVYIGDFGGILYSYSLDGELRWSVDTESGIVSPPALDDTGNIYVGNAQGMLNNISPAGELIWQHDGDGKVNGSPCITSDNRIVYATEDGFFYSVNPAGELVGEYDAGGQFFASPALTSTGQILIGNTDGYLYVFDTEANYIDCEGDLTGITGAGGDDRSIRSNDRWVQLANISGLEEPFMDACR